MDFIRADEEIPIESGMVSKSIEGAQKKVEAHHFDTRKAVLQYDDVLNTQREVIYSERRRILERADLKESIDSDLLEEHLDIILGTHIDPAVRQKPGKKLDCPKLSSACRLIFLCLADIKLMN